MAYFLLERKNRRQQYRTARRGTNLGGRITGAIILHDAENATDLLGPDSGAEAVARYIRDTRTDPGSYHVLTDRDSTIPMAPYEYEVWHDTTSNNYAIGISVAWRKSDLPKMTYAQRESYYRPFARAVLDAAAWVRREKGITVPLGKFQSRSHITSGKPGLSTHSRMDPSRRSDPFGTGSKYEREFLAVLADEAGTKGSAPAPNPGEDTPLVVTKNELADIAYAVNAYTNEDRDPRDVYGIQRAIDKNVVALTEAVKDLTTAVGRVPFNVLDYTNPKVTDRSVYYHILTASAVLDAVKNLPGVDGTKLAKEIAARVVQIEAADVAEHLTITTKED